MLDYRSGSQTLVNHQYSDPADGTISGGFSFRKMFFGGKICNLASLSQHRRARSGVSCGPVLWNPEDFHNSKRDADSKSKKKNVKNVTQTALQNLFSRKTKVKASSTKKEALPILKKKTMCISFFLVLQELTTKVEIRRIPRCFQN